jgi:aminopeptidase N
VGTLRRVHNVRRLLCSVLMFLAAAACGGTDRDVPDSEPGIPLAVAEARAARIANVRYDLTFAIPDLASDPITGTAAIRFDLKDAGQPVVIDFAPGAGHLTPWRWPASRPRIAR